MHFVSLVQISRAVVVTTETKGYVDDITIIALKQKISEPSQNEGGDRRLSAFFSDNVTTDRSSV